MTEPKDSVGQIVFELDGFRRSLYLHSMFIFSAEDPGNGTTCPAAVYRNGTVAHGTPATETATVVFPPWICSNVMMSSDFFPEPQRGKWLRMQRIAFIIEIETARAWDHRRRIFQRKMIDFFDENDNIYSGVCFHHARGVRHTFRPIIVLSEIIVFQGSHFASG